MNVQEKNGISLVELLMALAIGGLVIAGLSRVYVNFTRQNAIQRNIATLMQEVVTATQLMEKDGRMAGYGLPGNGLYMNIAGSDDTICMLSNEAQRSKSSLKFDANAADSFIIVPTSTDYIPGMWVLMKSGTTMVYRCIKRIEGSGSDQKLVMTQTLGTAFSSASTDAWYADGVRYNLQKTTPPKFIRNENGHVYFLGTLIDSFAVTAKDSIDGTLTDHFENTRALIIGIGGNSGTAQKPVRMRQTMRVNIKNYM
jgi:type II secretory pathway pseudopilin PulG